MIKINKIVVQAYISADRNKVWDYYTKPEHITQWNFASPEWYCPKAENELIVGGKYSARMEAKDGSFGFDFESIYDEINAPKNFTYTTSDNRKVTVKFDEHGDKTRVIVTFDAESESPKEMQKEGWQAILDNFKSYAESQ